jgi:hypothetical protein
MKKTIEISEKNSIFQKQVWEICNLNLVIMVEMLSLHQQGNSNKVEQVQLNT